MYNVFKPHGVKFKDGKFGIRRWSMFGWTYFCGTYWWTSNRHVLEYCHLTQERADYLWRYHYPIKDRGKRIK